MVEVVADRVRDTSTTTGTGAVTVSGTPPTGFRTFSAVCAATNTIGISIVNRDVPSEWETSIATYSSTNVLTRTTVKASSNSGSAVSFSAGTKDVIHGPIAVQFDPGTF